LPTPSLKLSDTIRIRLFLLSIRFCDVKTVMINDKPMLIVNNLPIYQSDKDKEKTRKNIERTLYDIFKKYN